MMSQNNTDKAAMRNVIATINAVEGFDPEPFAVEYADLESGETRKRLPVMIQMAWFRLKYPEGKITTKVTNGKDCFVATARVYPSYKDGGDCYLAEATASRGYLAEKPSVSPREWAQTAAVGIALRNAGFGLQFGMAGEDFPAVAPDELGMPEDGTGVPIEHAESGAEGPVPQPQPAVPQTPKNIMEMPAGQMQQSAVPGSGTQQNAVSQKPVQQELTYEERIQKAMSMPCPIKKYAGKTLGDLVVTDPNALNWIVNKFHDDKGTNEAARLICEYALGQASA
jgi:hypothetical protein